MRRNLTVLAVLVIAATMVMGPKPAEARGRGIGLGIAGAIIGTALLAGAYDYNRRSYRHRHYGYYDSPRYVYGYSYYPRHHRRHHHHRRYW